MTCRYEGKPKLSARGRMYVYEVRARGYSAIHHMRDMTCVQNGRGLTSGQARQHCDVRGAA